MEYLLEIVKDAEIVFTLISLISALLSYLSKKIKDYFDKIKNEKILKSSVMGELLADRMMLVLLQMSLFFILFLLVAFIFSFLIAWGKVKEPNPKNYFAIMLVMTFFLGEFIPKVRNNRKAFLKNLLNERKILRVKNILLFYFQSIILAIALIIIAIFEIPSTTINTIVFLFIMMLTMILTLKYFSATITEERYLQADISFNNAYPNIQCPCKYLIVDGSSFVSIKYKVNEITYLTKYNKNIIVKIDYIANETIEDTYAEHLRKRGFRK